MDSDLIRQTVYRAVGVRHPLLCIAALILLATSAFSQKSLGGVAKVEARMANGNIETGAGIICGSNGSEIFIVTALHVIADQDDVFSEDVKVTFHGVQWDPLSAKIDKKHGNPDLDYVIIIVEAPEGLFRKHDFRQPDFDKIETGDGVRMIGHPVGEDWTYNIQNVINNPQITTYQIGVSEIGVVPGYSGGALLHEKKDQLLGLIVKVGKPNTIAVRIDQILRDLRSWNIPHNHILPYRPPVRPIAYISAGLSAAAVAVGINFHVKAEDDYEIYKTNRDPNALGVYDAISREDLLARANDNKDKRNYALASAGGAAVLAVLFGGRKYKRKNKGITFLFDTQGDDLAIAKIGLAYQF